MPPPIMVTSYINEFDQLSKNALESSFPLHEFRNNHTVIKRVPWFTKGLLISSQRKRKLLSGKSLKPTERNITEIKQYNNILEFL